MREAYALIARRLREGVPVAVATLVETRRAAPAPRGTSIVIEADGSFAGNIGAGCHEAELIESARRILEDGRERTLSFDLDDELLDGSVCGASLDVAIWVPDPEFASTAQRIAMGEETARFTCAGHNVEIPAMRRLVVVGATDLAAELARAARAADFLVTVVDPRPEFATAARHPNAHRIVVDWPDRALPTLLEEASGIAIVAHDAKIDLPAIRAALDSNVAYVGVLGSRRAQRARAERLRAEGVSPQALARIHGPAGLDLGASSAAGTAYSILAECLAVANDRSALPLRDRDDSIH
jgi:xanthine dehydrogenase accessory factor